MFSKGIKRTIDYSHCWMQFISMRLYIFHLSSELYFINYYYFLENNNNDSLYIANSPHSFIISGKWSRCIRNTLSGKYRLFIINEQKRKSTRNSEERQPFRSEKSCLTEIDRSPTFTINDSNPFRGICNVNARVCVSLAVSTIVYKRRRPSERDRHFKSVRNARVP